MSSFVGPADARSFRVDEIPNGRARSCQTCHETGGGIVFNPFGSDVRSHLTGQGSAGELHVEWGPELAARDSDGDGVSNGAELGDPDGTWRIGDPSPGGIASAPGDPDNAASAGGCGDGVLGSAETCDSEQLRGATCENQNLGQGEMLCGLDCRLDATNCDGSTKSDDEPDAATADEGGCTMGSPGGDGLAAMLVAVIACAVGVARRRQRRFCSSRT